MGNDAFTEKCINLVVKYSNEELGLNITKGDVYVVWLTKALQNNKALLSTNAQDGMYYEVTYNGNKEEFYFDAYKKVTNQCHKA